VLRDAIERIVLEFPGYGYRRVTESWDSPTRAATLTLRDPNFFHSILLEVGETSLAQGRVQPAVVVEDFQVLEDGRLRGLSARELQPAHQLGLQGPDEALGYRIIQGRARTSHRRRDASFS